MATDSQIRARVMRRVYLMYCTRQVCKPVPRTAIFAVLFLALIGSFSIVNVISNVLSTGGFEGFVNLFVDAFAHTSTVVRVLTVALVGWVGWFLVDTVKN